MDKNELIITGLKQRIGDLMSNYEIQNVLLRAEFTEQVDKIAEMQKIIDEYSDNLQKFCDKEASLNKHIDLNQSTIDNLNEEIKILKSKIEKNKIKKTI
jgi:archaellum component FlaC